MRVTLGIIISWFTLAFVSCDPVFARGDMSERFELVELSEPVGTLNSGSAAIEKHDKFDLAIGSESRLEREVGSDSRESQSSTRLGLGAFLTESWLLQAQYGELRDSSRSGTFKVEESTREFMLSVTYLSNSSRWFRPLAGLGVGVFQDRIRSSLVSLDSESSPGDFKAMGQLHGGFRVQVSRFYLQFQGQILQKDQSQRVNIGLLSQLGMTL